MKIAVLGPKGTFSESALIKYKKSKSLDFDEFFCTSINNTFLAAKDDCDFGIVPIENTLDGYVQRSLDMLLDLDLHIIDEVVVPVQFSLISNVKHKEDIKKIYVQFKANGQCLKFLNSMEDVEIITTQSNTESYNLFNEESEPACAIIPQHMYSEKPELFSLENVTDSENNFTKFFVVTKDNSIENLDKSKNLKVSLYIIPGIDRPGVLYEILEQFYINKINLSSIISRPTKQNLGTYNFYIEVSGEYSDKEIIFEALEKLKNNYNLKILGRYSA